MQKVFLSLMQMPRTIIAVNSLSKTNLPFISILTDPTTGGVSASFAMIGDIIMAEKMLLLVLLAAELLKKP